MKKIIITLFALAMMLPARAQMTPEAVIANAPALPTPEQWGKYGHTEAFTAKIAELRDIVAKMTTATVKSITEADIKEIQAEQMREFQMAPQRMEQAAKGLEMMGLLMSRLNLSEADITKLSKMSDKESEAFIMKKMQESGLTPGDIAAMAGNVGLDTRQAANIPQIDADAVRASQQAEMAFAEQMQLYQNKAREWETVAAQRIKTEFEKYQAARPKNIYGLDDLMTKSVTQEQYDAQQRHLIELEREYYAAKYRIWIEVIHNCQGELKYLMQFAVTADNAKAKMPSTTSNAAFDALGKTGNKAAAIADKYLDVTESEPDIYEFEH